MTDTLSRIAILSPEHANQFNRFLFDFYTMQGRNARLYAQDTDPQTYADLWNQAKSGTLTADQLIPQAQKLSHEDFTSLLHETTKRTADVKLSDFPMENYYQIVKDAVVFGNAKTRDADFGGDFSLAEKDPDVAHRVTLAQTLFAETAHAYLNDPAFTKLPRDQQTATLRKAMDSISQEFGGFTDQQRQQAADEQKRVAETEKNKAEAILAGGVKFENGQGTTADGKTFGAPTALTDAARDQIRSLSATLSERSGDTARSLDVLYRYPNLGSPWNRIRSDWTGPNSFWNNWHPPALRSTDEAQLLAFIHNSRLLNKGNWYETPMKVVTDATGTHDEFTYDQ